jgi:hypothetical protein
MDSNFWYRGTKAMDFRSIPGIAGIGGADYVAIGATLFVRRSVGER